MSDTVASIRPNPDGQLLTLLMKRPKFLFLDAIHTLVELTPDVHGFFASIARAEGLDPDPQALAQALDKGHATVRQRLAARNDFSIDPQRERLFWRSIDSGILRDIGFGERAEEVADRVFSEFESGGHFRLLEETIPALERIRALEIPIGIVSNGTEGMDRWMRACPLAPLVEFILVSVVVGWEKPGPEIFRLALDRAGVEPREALHAGDSYEHDVLGASRAGIPAVLISPNDASRPLACPVLRHVGELPDFLASLSPA